MSSHNAPASSTALGATAVLIKSGFQSLGGYHLLNTTTAAAYVQVFDAAAAADVTVGTTTPTFVLGLPASGGAANSFAKPIKFTLGIVVASTTTATGASAATVCAAFFVGD